MTSRPSSPPAAPLELDDLLSEILIRLPPLPFSLPRASLVCKRWRGLVSDRGFLRRFRLHHHRRNPPLLGFFNQFDFVPTMDAPNLLPAGQIEPDDKIVFVPTMEPPNRIPHDPFSLQFGGGDEARCLLLGCRHGLVLIFHESMDRLLVWDPVTGDQHSFSLPPGFHIPKTPIQGAVVRAAGDAQHFQVVLLGTVQRHQHVRAIAQVYSSETGIWGNLSSVRLPPKGSGAPMVRVPPMATGLPSVLLGHSLYWSGSWSILEFDLDNQRLAVIPMPVNKNADTDVQFSLMRADDGGLGCLLLSEFSAQIWKRKTDSNGVTSWVLGRTIEMDKVLSLNSATEKEGVIILGFAEDNNVAFLWAAMGIYTVQLESLQFKKLFETNILIPYHPFESVYTADMCICSGHDGAELVHNASDDLSIDMLS